MRRYFSIGLKGPRRDDVGQYLYERGPTLHNYVVSEEELVQLYEREPQGSIFVLYSLCWQTWRVDGLPAGLPVFEWKWGYTYVVIGENEFVCLTPWKSHLATDADLIKHQTEWVPKGITV